MMHVTCLLHPDQGTQLSIHPSPIHILILSLKGAHLVFQVEFWSPRKGSMKSLPPRTSEGTPIWPVSSEKDSHLKIDTHEDKPHYNTGKSLYYCKLRNTKDCLPTTRSRRRPGRIALQARGGAGPCDSFNLNVLLAERLRQHISAVLNHPGCSTC